MIDLRSANKPVYGKLWVALLLGVAYDAMQRLPLLEAARQMNRKRKADPFEEFVSSKRRKMTPASTSEANAVRCLECLFLRL